jgi:drug/metabolite transporter (DMT)-like permease
VQSDARAVLRMNARSFAQLLLLGALWGAAFMFMRIAAPEFGAFALAGARVLMACAVMLVIVVVMRQPTHFKTHWKKYLVVGGVNTAIPFVAYCFAALYIPSGYSAIANSTTPIFGALIAWLWFKESLGASKWFGIVFAFTGVIALVGLQPVAITPMVIAGMLACLGAASMYATASFLIKRYLSDVPGIVGATGMVWGAMMWLVLPALWATPAAMPSSKAWFAVAALALGCTAFAYVLFFHLIKTIGPQRASSVAFLFPAFAAFWGWLFLDEAITANMLIGMALVLVGTALVSRSNAASPTTTVWEQLRDSLFLPLAFALLPTSFRRRLADWVRRSPHTYRFASAALRTELPKYLPHADVNAAERDLRFTRLTDHADLWFSLTRPSSWFARNVRISVPDELKTPALFVTFHYGGGWWMTRWLRSRGIPVSIVMRRGETGSTLIEKIAYALGNFRMRRVEQVCNAPLIATDDGNAARQTLRAWKHGTSVIGLVDLPPPLVDRTERVKFLDRDAQFPPTLIELANRAQIPIYAFIGEWDAQTLTPSLRVFPLQQTTSLSSLQIIVAALEMELRRRPGAWHSWSEAHLYFER